MMVSNRLQRITAGIRKSFVVMALFLITAASGVSAQTNLVFDTSGNIVGNYVGPRSIGADWVASGGASGGTRTVSAGSAVVSTSAGDLKVATSIGATYTAARMAGIAVKVARVGSVVGTAFTAWQVYNAIKDSGIAVCPPPDFFCVPDPSVKAYPNATYQTIGQAYIYTSALASAQARILTIYNGNGCHAAGPACPTVVTGCTETNGSTAWTCTTDQTTQVINGSKINNTPLVCPSGSHLVGTNCVADNLTPASDGDISGAVGTKEGTDPNYGPKLLGAARGDSSAHPGAIPPSIFSPVDLPIDVTAPPVTGPLVTTGTNTAPNADGSTSTTTTKQQTTVTPTVTGTTVGDTNVKYDSSTITTNTTVNNTTNVTTTSSTTSNTATNSAGPTTPFPTDYSREPTQQQVLTELKGDGAPTLPDQKVLVDAAKSANDTGIGQAVTDAKNGQNDKSAWFSWVWTAPGGSCSPFAGSVHGYAISWDLCPTIANINAVLGWLFALFGAMQIYEQLFRKGDE